MKFAQQVGKKFIGNEFVIKILYYISGDVRFS